MTFWKMSKSGSLFIKTISILLIQTFLFSTIAFAAPKQDAPAIPTPQDVIANPERIAIPKEAGLVKSRFAGNSGRLIIHIQDAHCNYEAQSNIVKILENLVKNYNLGLVSVEGADGVIDTSWFKAFPDDEVRKEVADYFMKKGEITGPEFLSITTDLPVKLFGAETRSHYIDNLNAFTSSYPLKEHTERYLNQVKVILNRLKTYIYSDELKYLDARMQEYESKKMQFNDYVRFLQGAAEKEKINLREYANFFKLVSVLIYEKKIDFNVTDKERNTLIDELSKILSKEALTELVTESVSFKVGKISSAEYYNYLKALAIDNKIDLGKKYPNLYNYIIYNSVYSKIENEKLFNDIKKIETAIKEKLFQNDDQRVLEKLSRHIDILLGLVNIKLLNGDFEYYKANKREFNHEAFFDFIKKKTVQYGFAYDVESPDDSIANSIQRLEDFYAIATKRDKALVDNTLGQMKKEKLQISVLVTGGFHSEGITKLLEKEGVSYLVVCPTITKDVPSPYIQILTNQKTPLEQILIGTAHAKEGKNGTVAAPCMTWLVMRDNARDDVRKGLVDFGGRTAAEREREFKAEWVSVTVKGIEGEIRVNGELLAKVDVAGLVETMLTGVGGSRLTAGDVESEIIKQLNERCPRLGLSRPETNALIAGVKAGIPNVREEFRKEIERQRAAKLEREARLGRAKGRNGSVGGPVSTTTVNVAVGGPVTTAVHRLPYLTLDDVDVAGKTVGVRVDLNVKKKELSDENIRKDQIHIRIVEAAKTLKELADRGARVVALAHQARFGEDDYMEFLEKHRQAIQHVIDSLEAEAARQEGRAPRKYSIRAMAQGALYDESVKARIKALNPGEILLLKNVRAKDGESEESIKALEKLFGLYVIDGFSVAHRGKKDGQWSIDGFTGIPNVAGRTMQRELEGLATVTTHLEKPYVMSLGGLKIDDYLSLLEAALREGRVDTILTSGALAQVLLVARGFEIGQVNVDFLKSKMDFDRAVAKVKELDALYPGKFIMPADFVIADVDPKTKAVKSRSVILTAALPLANLPIYDIGPTTIDGYLPYIDKAKTIYIKGPVGAFDINDAFSTGTRAIFGRISERTRTGELYSFGGGGETDMALEKFGIMLSHETLAGGAMLEALAGAELPGVAALTRVQGTRTPGTGAARRETHNKPLSDQQALAIDKAISETISAGRYREVAEPNTRGVFVVLDDEFYENAAKKHGAPLDVESHPGTKGTRANYDPQVPESYLRKVQRRYYILRSIFEKLSKEERLIFALHEEMHIKIALGIVRLPEGANEEDFVNGQAGCDIRPVMARLGSVSHMADILLTDTTYGTAVRQALENPKEVPVNARKEFIRTVYSRRVNIDRMKKVLSEDYRGYDVIIISSTTEEEARHQQEVVEKAFAGVQTRNRHLDGKVCVLSVCDPSEGGQIIGQINTWVKATELFADWARRNNVPSEDLDALYKEGVVRIATYHNGGKAERFSPAGQSYNLSRADQPLVGHVMDPKGNIVRLNLLLTVILSTANIAQTNDGSRHDVFWANQIDFGTIDLPDLRRTNFAIDKLLVRIPPEPAADTPAMDRFNKSLFDYGTAIVDETGRILKFLANKVLSVSSNGKYVINERYSPQRNELLSGRSGFYDYGSFSMSRDMHYALLDYWKNVRRIFEVMEKNGGRADVPRDIDPAFIQILVPLANGLNGAQLPSGLPAADELRSMPPTDEKWKILEEAYKALLTVMPANYVTAINSIYADKKTRRNVLETVDFYLIYRDSIFRDLARVIGHVDLGENGHWFAYKRLLDMANEKFCMLADLIGSGATLELDTTGEPVMIRDQQDGNKKLPPADIWDRLRAEDARRLRRIADDAVAVFEVMGHRIVLSAEEVRKGWSRYGVEVRGSIIQGNTVLLPGSRVINSVVNDVQGRVSAENSYVESTASPLIEAMNSIIVKGVDSRSILAEGTIVADAYRPDIHDPRFHEGQTRMSAEMGYEPKPGYNKFEKNPKSGQIELTIEDEQGVSHRFLIDDGGIVREELTTRDEQGNMGSAILRPVGEYKRAVGVSRDGKPVKAKVWFEEEENRSVPIFVAGKMIQINVTVKDFVKTEGTLLRDEVKLYPGHGLSPSVEKSLRKRLEQGEYYADADNPDPKKRNRFLARPKSDYVIFGNNYASFHDIRRMPCKRTVNERIENELRVRAFISARLREGLIPHIKSMHSSGRLTEEFVRSVFEYFNNSKPDSRTRTEIVYLCNLLKEYGGAVASIASEERRYLLAGNLGPTIEPAIFLRDSVRGVADDELSDAVVKAAGFAYVKLIAQPLEKKPEEVTIGVGRESRQSGKKISGVFTEGCLIAGANVIDATDDGRELTSTPLMYFASRYLLEGELDGIVEVTASHLEAAKNGLKPTRAVDNFTPEEMHTWLEATHDAIDEGVYNQTTTREAQKTSVLEPYQVLLAASLEGSEEWLGYVKAVWEGKMTLKDAIDRIRPRANKYMEQRPLEGLIIAADSGFGSMGPIIGPFLQRLGVNLTDIGPEADYTKAVKDANPNNPDNLQTLINKVSEIAAMIGIAFDVDGDRLGTATFNGAILRGDDISCLIAPVVIQEAKSRGVSMPIIVVNVLCSDRLKKIIEDAGGIALESAVGFNKVKAMMFHPYDEYFAYLTKVKGLSAEAAEKELAGMGIVKGATAEMGVEISSHIMFRENFNADDAFFAVVKLLRIIRARMDEPGVCKRPDKADMLDGLFEKLPRDYHTGEWRMRIVSDHAKEEVAGRMAAHYERMASEYPKRYRIRSVLDGIKVEFLNENGEVLGWLAIRTSGTEPRMVFSINSLVSEDAFNFIKNDFFAQLEIYKDLIEGISPAAEKPGLEPKIFYDQAVDFISKGRRLPTGNLSSKRSKTRTPGTGAARNGETEPFSREEFVSGILADESFVLPEGITDAGAEALAARNELKERIRARYAAYLARPVSEAETAMALYAVLSEVARLRREGRIPAQVAAAQLLTSMGVEAEAGAMTGELEFTDARYAPRPKGQELPTSYFDRGSHDATYMLSRGILPQKAVGFWRLFAQFMYRAVYNMAHFGRLHAVTSFDQACPLYAGTIIYQTTGVHSQAKAYDIKLVREGTGVQLISWFDRDKKKVCVIHNYLKPGSVALSIPGTEDTIINLGGLKFSDRSFEVNAQIAERIARQLDIPAGQLLNPKFNEEMPGCGMPYIVYMDNGRPYFAIHPDIEAEGYEVVDRGWMKYAPAISGEKVFNPVNIEEYESALRQTLESDEAAGQMVEKILTEPLGAGKEAPATLTEKPRSYSEFASVNERARRAYEALDRIIREGRPIKQKPLFMAGEQGYKWGQPVKPDMELKRYNAILELMGKKPEEMVKFVAEHFDITEEEAAKEVLAERWLCAGLIDTGTGYYLPVEALSFWPSEVFGEDHLREYGPNVGITVKHLASARPLSVQCHDFDEMIVAQGEGTAYIGLKKGISPEDMVKALLTGEIKGLMNEVNLEEGQVYLVPAGMLHAYGEVNVFEVKAVTAAEDKAGTRSFYDRLWLSPEQLAEVASIVASNTPEAARKILIEKGLVRDGKDALTMDRKKLEENIEAVRKAGYLNAVNPDSCKVMPMSVAQTGKSALELLSANSGFALEKYTLEAGAMPRTDITSFSPHVLFVQTGKVQVSFKDGRVFELKAGEEMPVAANAGEYEIVAVGEKEAAVYSAYKPLAGEGVVYSGFEAWTRERASRSFQEKRGDIAKNHFAIWLPKELFKNNAFARERSYVMHITDGVTDLAQYQFVDGAQLTGFDIAKDVLVVRQSDLAKLQADPKLANILASGRILVIPNAHVDKANTTNRTFAYLRELEVLGIITGDTKLEDLADPASTRAQDFTRIMERFTGRKIGLDDLRRLLSAEAATPEAISERLKKLAHELLLTMPIERNEIDDAIDRNRRQVLWSV